MTQPDYIQLGTIVVAWATLIAGLRVTVNTIEKRTSKLEAKLENGISTKLTEILVGAASRDARLKNIEAHVERCPSTYQFQQGKHE